MAEIRVSPDGNAVAIRGEQPEDAWNAWAVMNRISGGHWAAVKEVQDWLVLSQ